METRKISRREALGYSLKFSAAAAAGPLLSMSGCSKETFSTDPDLPNILLITADNLGIGDLSCYGNVDVNTAHIDSIGKDGTQFNNAFVVSSSCAPSRATFITGQYPTTNGVDALTHLKPWQSLSPFKTTMIDLFKKKGYNTAVEGKWHVAPYFPTSWYGYNERLSGIFADDHVIKDSSKTIDFLKRNRDNRFFLQVNYKNSHRDRWGEYHFDPEFPFDPEKITIPDYMALPDWPEIREDVAKYFSQNMVMDKAVGEVLQALEDLGLAENTLVMFVSDNGPHYPGMIMTCYDRGAATPLLVRWPGKIKPGRQVDHLISSVDIMPTLLEAAGISVPESVEGKSFLSMMTDEKPEPIRDEVFIQITDHVRWIPTRAVRTHRWKYIKNYSDNPVGLDMNNHDEWAHRMCELPNHPWKRPRVPEELYDLKRDPNEQNNLAGNPKYRGIQEELEKRLKAHMERTNDPFLGEPFSRDFDPEEYKPVPPGHKYF